MRSLALTARTIAVAATSAATLWIAASGATAALGAVMIAHWGWRVALPLIGLGVWAIATGAAGVIAPGRRAGGEA